MAIIPTSSQRLSLLLDGKIHDKVSPLYNNMTMHDISKQSYNRSGQKTRSEFSQAALANSSTGTPFTCATTQAIVVTDTHIRRLVSPLDPILTTRFERLGLFYRDERSIFRQVCVRGRSGCDGTPWSVCVEQVGGNGQRVTDVCQRFVPLACFQHYPI
jgi:hypothetical protein